MNQTYKIITCWSHNDNKAVSYSNMASNNEEDIIKWLLRQGVGFKGINGCECHDIGDTDFFQGSVHTDDVDKILEFINKLYGEWTINAIYRGIAIRINKMYPNIVHHLSFTYPKAQEQNVIGIFTDFEKLFCYPEIKEQEQNR